MGKQAGVISFSPSSGRSKVRTSGERKLVEKCSDLRIEDVLSSIALVPPSSTSSKVKDR